MESGPSDIFVNWAYILGTLAAIVYKTGVGSTKHLIGKTFRLRVLVWPILIATLISFPLVFIVMPKFGRPTGIFLTDMIYAYLTTYALIDMTADFYIISAFIERKFEQAADGDRSKEKPPMS